MKIKKTFNQNVCILIYQHINSLDHTYTLSKIINVKCNTHFYVYFGIAYLCQIILNEDIKYLKYLKLLKKV